MYLIAGLGNPGARYRNTRHNVGFRVINLWGERLGVRLNGRRFQSRNGRAVYQDREIILLRPLTFMNRSGQSIKACLDFYRLKAEHILVVHDDIDLPLGRVRVVRKGGGGGHRGVLSIGDQLGTRAFSRVKIGVGRPRCGESIETYVLSPFYREEREVVEEVIRRSVQACELFVSEGVGSAMNQINCKNLAHKEVTN